MYRCKKALEKTSHRDTVGGEREYFEELSKRSRSSTRSLRINVGDAHYKRFVRMAWLPVQNKGWPVRSICVITQIRKQKPFVRPLNIAMTHFDNQEDFRRTRIPIRCEEMKPAQRMKSGQSFRYFLHVRKYKRVYACVFADTLISLFSFFFFGFFRRSFDFKRKIFEKEWLCARKFAPW